MTTSRACEGRPWDDNEPCHYRVYGKRSVYCETCLEHYRFRAQERVRHAREILAAAEQEERRLAAMA